jgi:hypothetical protein
MHEPNVATIHDHLLIISIVMCTESFTFESMKYQTTDHGVENYKTIQCQMSENNLDTMTRSSTSHDYTIEIDCWSETNKYRIDMSKCQFDDAESE